MRIHDYMTVSEAAYKWNVPQETVKNKLKPSIVGKERIDEMIEKGYIKYFQKPNGRRKEWIITTKAMEIWFGQPNPKGGRKLKESWTVTVEKEPGTPYPEYEETVYSEKEAEKLAQKWASEHKGKYVYIAYFRPSDGQHAYLNPDGYDLTGKNWANA